MNRTIHVASGHTMFVESIAREDLPEHLAPETEAYDKFYVVKNWDRGGVVFMYLGKGHADAPTQVVAWYRESGAFWSGYGKNLKSAIEGAQRDGWMYA